MQKLIYSNSDMDSKFSSTIKNDRITSPHNEEFLYVDALDGVIMRFLSICM